MIPPFSRLIATGLALTFSLGALAGMTGLTAAQSDLPPVENLCDDGLMDGNSANVAAIADIVTGTWSQAAAGMRFATGVQQNTATISYNTLTGNLEVRGEEGPVELHPIRSATIASGLTRRSVADAQVDFTRTGTEDGVRFEENIKTSGDNLLELYECDVENAPMFWWERGAGSGRAYGFIVFITEDVALGYMAFTDPRLGGAEASRTVYMYR